jgi:Tol biopolymer transport system component
METNNLHFLKWFPFLLLLLLGSSRLSAQVDHNIYVYDVLRGTYQQVSSIPDQSQYNPCWSPNGKYVAYESVDQNWYQALYVTDLRTGKTTLLTGGENGNDVSWAPDGQKLMFDDWYNIYTVPAGGGTPTMVRVNGCYAEWSPDSRYIVFFDYATYCIKTKKLADEWDCIKTKKPSNGEETSLVYGGENPDWSPNGRYIAYDDWNVGGIWIIEVNPWGKPVGDPVQLTTSGSEPSWSNNSKSIIYCDLPPGSPTPPPGTWPSYILSISIRGGTPEVVCGLGGPNCGNYDPCYSSNGKYIAFSAAADPSMQPGTRNTPASASVTKNAENYLQVIAKPNPSHYEFELVVSTNSPEPISLRLLDAQGRVVFEQANVPGNSSIKIGSNLVTGTYLADIRQGTRCKLIKLLKY